jgi:enoyl-CoA hydratase/carnithine racemase
VAGGADLRIERDGAVMVLTLDRPDALNTFTGAMGAGLEAAYREADGDDGVRAVVLTGAGRAFCAGADVSAGSGVFDAPEDADRFSSDPFDVHAWDVRKPVLAAVNGHAVGIGLTLALHCDLRYLARGAKYGVVQNRRGILPDLRSHWVLPRLVGQARATEILLTGRIFDADEAERWGLANEALAADDVLDRALAVAHDLATNAAPVSVAASKRLLWRSPGLESDEADDLESRLHLHLMGGPDAREGITAFVEHRDPQWSQTLAEDWPAWLDDG